MYPTISTNMLGTPKLELPLSHREQPLILQIAAIAFDDEGNEIEKLCAPLKPSPDNRPGSQGGNSLHPRDVFSWFTERAASCDLLIGHNAHFDLHAVRVLGARTTGEDWVPKAPIYCTMINAAPVMNLPAKSAADGRLKALPRAPTLAEAIDFFYDEKFTEDPDRISSSRACHRIFRALVAHSGSNERISIV